MVHEEIIKREDGTRYKIVVSIGMTYYSHSKPYYSIELYTKGKNKRKWVNFTWEIVNNYSYRKLSLEDRNKFLLEKYLEVVTKEEILNSKLKL